MMAKEEEKSIAKYEKTSLRAEKDAYTTQPRVRVTRGRSRVAF